MENGSYTLECLSPFFGLGFSNTTITMTHGPQSGPSICQRLKALEQPGLPNYQSGSTKSLRKGAPTYAWIAQLEPFETNSAYGVKTSSCHTEIPCLRTQSVTSNYSIFTQHNDNGLSSLGRLVSTTANFNASGQIVESVPAHFSRGDARPHLSTQAISFSILGIFETIGLI